MNVCGVTFGGYLAKILSFKSGNYQIPSKSLNVYNFGMKMYTSQPIKAQLFLQQEL